MKIPDEVRKTVGFVGFYNQVDKQFEPRGSMFFLGHDPIAGHTASPKMYAVTARHIIDQLLAKGAASTRIRLNARTADPPFVEIDVPMEDWFVHPNDKTIDVAIYEMGIPQEADHLVIPLSMAATKQKFVEHEVELGDEVLAAFFDIISELRKIFPLSASAIWLP